MKQITLPPPSENYLFNLSKVVTNFWSVTAKVFWNCRVGASFYVLDTDKISAVRSQLWNFCNLLLRSFSFQYTTQLFFFVLTEFSESRWYPNRNIDKNLRFFNNRKLFRTITRLLWVIRNMKISLIERVFILIS